FHAVLVHTQGIGNLVTHGVHRVVSHVAVERPITWCVSDELDIARSTHRAKHRSFRPLPCFGNLSAVGGSDVEGVAVDVNGMVPHAQVADANAHAIIGAYDKAFNGGEDFAVEGPQVK